MPYDDGLAHRVRRELRDRHDVTERQMFGGIGFMHDGNLVCGVHGEALLARVGPAAYESALEASHVRPMDLTGTPMRGIVFVDPPGTAADEDLAAWIERCLAFAVSLPPK